MSEADLLVVGAGLIGTSVGLAAAAAGRTVLITDRDPRRSELAAAMGAGTAVGGLAPAATVVVAVPPAVAGASCVGALAALANATVTHVCSVQAGPAAEVEAESGGDVRRFVGGHPIAGREVSGPTAATSDLFVDRPWAVCPVPGSSQESIDAVVALARDCGADPVLIAPEQHDLLLARLSHAPQIVASALAATLAGLPGEQARLAGTGIRDTTRLADSDPVLWAQIAAANAPALAAALRRVGEPLLDLAQALDSGDPVAAESAVHGLVEQGRRGRAALPGKHGRTAAPHAVVRCLMPDSPGALARLFTDTAAEGVNVEDLRVEHVAGQPVGFAELVVAPDDQARLVAGLRGRGWVVSEGADEAL